MRPLFFYKQNDYHSNSIRYYIHPGKIVAQHHVCQFVMFQPEQRNKIEVLQCFY